MANKEEHPPRVNEWEVISLTSSAYAASPGPYNNVESRRSDAYYGEAETSRDLFMSDHFVPLDEDERKDGEGQGLSDKSLNGEPALTSSQHMDSAMYEHGLIESEPNEYADEDLDHHGLDKDATHNLPCEAWWRKRAVSMYLRTREANATWSLFFAAAATGLVVLGQRWQQERWQVLQLKWHSSITSEKLRRVLEPISRLKTMIVRSNPQASLVRSGTSSEL